MINTLLEHVPIKMETKDEVVEIHDEGEHIKDDDDVVNSGDDDEEAIKDDEEIDDDDEDEDDDDDEEDEEEEDEVLDVEQEVTLLISSDEEAELEAQRIRFPEKRTRKKSNDSKSSRSTSRNSNTSNKSSKAQESATFEHKDKTVGKEHQNKKEKVNNKEAENGKDKEPENVSAALESRPPSRQRSSQRNRKENKIQNNLSAATTTECLRQTSRRQSNNSTCSISSSIASDSNENESCGNIYVYSAEQKLIFNCEFCDLKYGDLDNLGRHLHQSHRLFMQQDEDHEKENSPRNMRSKQNQQLLPQKPGQHTLSVKKEPLQALVETSPTTAAPVATSLLPPVALTLDIQSEHSLQSCGNVFILNHRKLFLICGYCESKYANKELFEKHLQQQHDVFEEPAQNEVNVVPKREIKEEVFDSAEVAEVPPMERRNTLPGAMVSIPAEIPLDISTSEITQEEEEEAEDDARQKEPEGEEFEIQQKRKENEEQEISEEHNEKLGVAEEQDKETREKEGQKEQLRQQQTEKETQQDEDVEVAEQLEVLQKQKKGKQEEVLQKMLPEQDNGQQATEVAQKVTQVNEGQQVTQEEDEGEHINDVVTENHTAQTEEHGRNTPMEVEVQEEQLIQPITESNENSDDVILTSLDDVTATVISSSIQILDTGVTVAEIPVVLTEQPMPMIGEVVSVLSLPHSDISQEVQETPQSSSPPSPLTNRKTRKRRSPQIQKVDLEDNSPNKRPKRNTRKTLQPKIEEPETKPIIKSLSRPKRSVANRKKETSAEPVINNESVPIHPFKNSEATAFTPAVESETEPEPSTSQSTQISLTKQIKKEKEKKPRRKSVKTKIERDSSPPRVITITQILPSDSQLSERDEEFIEDPVADIIAQIQREMNANAAQPLNSGMARILTPTTLTGLTAHSVPPSEALLSPNIKPNISNISLLCPIDFKPIINEFGERRFVCDQCPRSFKKHVRLVQHRRIHTGEKPFTCDECGKKFRIRNLLNEHKLRHSKEKKFICEICNLGCCTKQDYKLHMRHHTNDRRFQCSMCPKAFVRNADLKIHFRVHTGEKPFVCDICHKCFRANQNLGVHKKSHMGEASKTYKCELCEKKFTRNIDRKVHMRSHTGEKPFKCEICDRAYSSRFNVKAHIERDHMSEKGKKKPGPKPKALKAELEQQRKLIEELQAQLKRQIKTDEMIIPADSSLNESTQDESIMETSNPLPEGFEIVHLSQPTNLTAISSPPSPPSRLKQKQNVATKPLTIVQKMERQSSSSSSVCSTTPSPPKKTTTKVVSQKTSLGVQQVSVTVSMQVENVTTSAVSPEKETTGITSVQLTSKTTPPTSSVKKERKITSYFTVLNQKAEV